MKVPLVDPPIEVEEDDATDDDDDDDDEDVDGNTLLPSCTAILGQTFCSPIAAANVLSLP